MSRAYEKLRVYAIADRLTLDVYRLTKDFPASERFGLRAQTRRACVSAAVNIVEGSARSSTKEFVHFLTVSLGSASETRYLLELAQRLGMISSDDATLVTRDSTHLIRALQRLIGTLSR